mmetsp:Transcript_87576/g.165056  ORF Transcript_87576/g.165056 Transcript_87576/m.165056 type:complete len:479 (+) Transcript_87576:101-1537(+)
MIRYDNGKQFRIIFHATGSVLPACMPMGLFCFLFGLGLAIYREIDGKKESSFLTRTVGAHNGYIDDPFAALIVATVLGYLLVVRTNMALGRWMEGISDIQMMLSKWGDAYDALSAFFTGKDGTREQLEEILMFRIRVAHWLSLMSCLAFATLRNHGVLGPLEAVPIRELLEDVEFGTGKPTRAKSFAVSRIGVVGDSGRSSTTSNGTGEPAVQNLDSMVNNAGSLPNPGGSRSAKAEPKFDSAGVEDVQLAENMDLKVLSMPSAQEVALLDMAEDKPNTICLWIIQGVILMVRKKLLDIPPPIVSRIFQELSNGMLGFNQAHKVAMVPFPFPFAQMVSLLLCMTYLAIPLYADLFTQNVVFTPIVSFVLPVVFAALNKIAIELEEPFGLDYNDVDIEVRHEDFLWLLVDVLRAPKQPPSYPDNQHEIEIWRGVFREALYVADEFEEYKPNRGKSEADMEADRSFALQSRDDSRDKATE